MRPTYSALATNYFSRFAAAFATFDGEQVAELFVAPTVALGSNGSLIVLSSRVDVVRYYQSALNRYRLDGCRSCRWSDLSATAMGSRALLAAVTWDLLREDESVVRRWRQSYSLSLFGADGPKAFATASHVEE